MPPKTYAGLYPTTDDSFFSTLFDDTPSPKPGDLVTLPLSPKSHSISQYMYRTFFRSPSISREPRRTRTTFARYFPATPAATTAFSIKSAARDKIPLIPIVPYLHLRNYLHYLADYVASTARMVLAMASLALKDRHGFFIRYFLEPFKRIIQEQCTAQITETALEIQKFYPFYKAKNDYIDWFFPPVLNELCFMIGPEPHSGTRFAINFLSKTVGLGEVLPRAIRCIKCVKVDSGRRRSEHALTLLLFLSAVALIIAYYLLSIIKRKWNARIAQDRQRQVAQEQPDLDDNVVMVENPFEGVAEDAIRRAANQQEQGQAPPAANQPTQDPQAANQPRQASPAANQPGQAPQGDAQ